MTFCTILISKMRYIVRYVHGKVRKGKVNKQRKKIVVFCLYVEEGEAGGALLYLLMGKTSLKTT